DCVKSLKRLIVKSGLEARLQPAGRAIPRWFGLARRDRDKARFGRLKPGLQTVRHLFVSVSLPERLKNSATQSRAQPSGALPVGRRTPPSPARPLARP